MDQFIQAVGSLMESLQTELVVIIGAVAVVMLIISAVKEMASERGGEFQSKALKILATAGFAVGATYIVPWVLNFFQG